MFEKSRAFGNHYVSALVENRLIFDQRRFQILDLSPVFPSTVEYRRLRDDILKIDDCRRYVASIFLGENRQYLTRKIVFVYFHAVVHQITM